MPNLLLEKVHQSTFHHQCVSSQSHLHLAIEYSFSYHKYFVAFNEYRKSSTEYLNGCVSWPQSDPEILPSQRLWGESEEDRPNSNYSFTRTRPASGSDFSHFTQSVHRAVIPQLYTETFQWTHGYTAIVFNFCWWDSDICLMPHDPPAGGGPSFNTRSLQSFQWCHIFAKLEFYHNGLLW